MNQFSSKFTIDTLKKYQGIIDDYTREIAIQVEKENIFNMQAHSGLQKVNSKREVTKWNTGKKIFGWILVIGSSFGLIMLFTFRKRFRVYSK